MVYHFIYTDNATIEQNAQSTYDNIKKAGLDPTKIWIAADLEYDTWKKNKETCTKDKCTKYTKQYLDYLKKLGCKKLFIYTNQDYYNNYYDWTQLKDYPLWIAYYKDSPFRSCAIHQYSASGAVKGINGNVDMDYLYDESMLIETSSATKNYLSKGDTGEAVKTMQKMLIKLGYSCGKAGIDGDFGTNTYNALIKFQKENNLEVDGKYGPKSKAKLTELYNKKIQSETYLSKGSKGSAVKEMQKMLIKLGYSCGSSGVDGDFGTNTETALARFQKANGLSADGVYGPKTKEKLVDLYNKAIKNSSSTSSKTGVTANDILGVMRGWIGLSRSAKTHKVIIDTYNSYKPLARGYKVTYTDAYCDATVSAAFIKLNAVNLIGGTECGVERHVEIFKKAGIWEEDGRITPKPGYIIVYNWDDSTQPNNGWSDHIGIVEKVENKKITVIEGNMKGGVVGRRTIPIGWGYIRGFAKPKYS